MKTLHYDLSYDQSHWICKGDDVQFRVADLNDLDMELRNYLVKKYQKGDFKIKMYFDFEHFPLWLRQYMAHYFNRELIYQL